MHPTKLQLLTAGLGLLLEHGYNDLGISTILEQTGIPKGSFYHHFADKESFAIEVVDAYMQEVHDQLDATLADGSRAPVARIRAFFAAVTKSYEQQGYMGCLLGGLGQELSGVNPVFRDKIRTCFEHIGQRLAQCLEEAKSRGELAASADSQQLAALLVDCWEGAALRSRLTSDPKPLSTMLDFYFDCIPTL